MRMPNSSTDNDTLVASAAGSCLGPRTSRANGTLSVLASAGAGVATACAALAAASERIFALQYHSWCGAKPRPSANLTALSPLARHSLTRSLHVFAFAMRPNVPYQATRFQTGSVHRIRLSGMRQELPVGSVNLSPQELDHKAAQIVDVDRLV